MTVIEQIAEYKKDNNIAIENLTREKEIIYRLSRNNKNLNELFSKFMVRLFEVSKLYQELLIKEKK